MLKAIIEEQNIAEKVIDYGIVKDIGAELHAKMS
jgi:hypothetical protein